MSSNNYLKKLHKLLAKFLVMTLVLSNIALTPITGMAAVKAPELKSTTKNILVGKEAGLAVKNKVSNSSYSWKSNHISIATVNKNGVVKGIAKGNATITCTVSTAFKTYRLRCKVNVLIPADSIKISSKVSTIEVGKNYNLKRIITPDESNDKTYWKSSDNSIAKVSTKGKVSALKEGTVTITASTLSGKKDSIKLTIVSAKTEKTVTAKDIKDGAIKLTNATYDILTIDNSVGEAEVILDHVNVKEALYMEADASYTVRAVDSDINKVVALEAKAKIVSFAENDQKPATPTFIAD